MPRRLDPDKGLPGLFQPSKAPSADMGFLVRPTGADKKARGRKEAGSPPSTPARAERPTRARGGVPAPEALAPPASTISEISGGHKRPRANGPVVESVTTSATDVAPQATATSSAAFARPTVVTVPAPAKVLVPARPIDVEAHVRARRLCEASPICRVPELAPRPPALGLDDAVSFAGCALSWAVFAVRQLSPFA